MTGVRRGCYPGSFDPLTVAHLAIADAAVRQCDLHRLDLVISRQALAKASSHAPVDERVAAIEAAAVDGRPWLGVVVTDAQLLVDIAAGYDVVVLGADKWAQVLDVAFYGSARERDAAVSGLPAVACAPRPGFEVPPGAVALDVPTWVGAVSSTAVRAGAEEWRAGRSPQGAPTRQSPE